MYPESRLQPVQFAALLAKKPAKASIPDVFSDHIWNSWTGWEKGFGFSLAGCYNSGQILDEAFW